ncbi:glutathione S-transferase family protein [Massilia arenosa]|uniref:Glutathione S-transferase family protein n=1 Tax=Zemynaea arenosa TaxID=2561931 RepID=A0A4Y9SK37_9BURK|nr:glutathione S-transferase family protein [Massilia arenosa]TFW26269.1 glutathione S-transferase family protein [Massilia arenosa]
MRLYQHPMSTNARRVTLAAAHVGVPLELVEVNLMSEEARRRLEELNPNSKVPVLEDDGFVLWESNAIIQYLCEKRGGHPAYPAGLRERADVNRWLFWGAQHWAPAVSTLAWETFFKGALGIGAADPAMVAKGEAEVARFAAVLDTHLAGRTWVCGDGVTLADLALAAPLMYKDQARLPLASHAHLLAWFARVQQLPAWQATA